MPVLSKDALGVVVPLHPRLQGLAGQSLGPYLVDAIVQVSRAGAEYVGRDEATGDEVRLVVLDPLLPQDDVHRRVLARLRRCIGRIQHPGCQQIVASELLHGPSGPEGGLEALICSADLGVPLAYRMRGPTRPALVERMAMALLGVLMHLHERDIVHGDVRPANVLLDPDTETFTMLTGLGAETRLLTDPPPDEDAPAPSNSGFLSPERMAGKGIDARADLYALGLTLRVLLSGLPVRELRLAIAEGRLRDRTSLERWLSTMTASSPDDRFPSAAHALEQLRAYRLLESVHASTSGARLGGRVPERQPGIVSGELLVQTTDRIETGIAAPEDEIRPFDSTTATQPERRAPDDPRELPAAASGFGAALPIPPRSRVGVAVIAASVVAIAAGSVFVLTYGDGDRLEPSRHPVDEPALAATLAGLPPERETEAAVPSPLAEIVQRLNAPTSATMTFDERHRELERVDALLRAQIDMRWQLALDLQQASQAADPCVTFERALAAVAAQGDAYFVSVLAGLEAPRHAGEACGGLDAALDRVRKQLAAEDGHEHGAVRVEPEPRKGYASSAAAAWKR